MDNGFRKFKQKQRTSAIVRALLAGISLGVIVVAAFWLIAKLSSAEANFLLWGLIGGGLALVVIGVLLAVLLPTDKRLAKRLDTKLELNEKVQTMIAFREEEGEMIQLQRDDTQEILMQAPGKKMRSKSAWVFAVLPVLACGCLIGSILVKAQEPEPPAPPVDPTWRLDQFDRQNLDDLIKHVQDSAMDAAPKDAVVLQLEGLKQQLELVKKESVMKETVTAVITNVHQIVKDHNDHGLIVNPLLSASSAEVKKLAQTMDLLKAEEITKYFDTLEQTLGVAEKKEEDSEEDQAKTKAGNKGMSPEERAAEAASMVEAIRQVLDNSKDNAEHPLYKALEAFAQLLEGITAESSEKAVRDILDEAEDLILNGLASPIANFTEEVYVINRLVAIFGISKESLPPELLAELDKEITDGGVGKDDDYEETNKAGGLGDGATAFGRDDQIYDPDLNEQVMISTVMDKYGAVISDYRKEGSVTDELDKAITDFFAFITRFDDVEKNP